MKSFNFEHAALAHDFKAGIFSWDTLYILMINDQRDHIATLNPPFNITLKVMLHKEIHGDFCTQVRCHGYRPHRTLNSRMAISANTTAKNEKASNLMIQWT